LPSALKIGNGSSKVYPASSDQTLR
jgi:hypothetical protein